MYWLDSVCSKIKGIRRVYTITFDINCDFINSDSYIVRNILDISDFLSVEIKKLDFRGYTKRLKIKCNVHEKEDFIRKLVDAMGDIIENIKI